MEAQGTSKQSLSGGKASCKCSEGWSCVITRTVGPDAGKTFAECGGGCSCVIDADGTVSQDLKVQAELENLGKGAEVYCECGEGWSCAISKIEGPDKAKPFYNCAEKSCTCTTTA